MNRDCTSVPMIEELSAGYVPAFDPALFSRGERGLLRPAILVLVLMWFAVFVLVLPVPAPIDPPGTTAHAVKDLAGAGKKAAAATDSALRQEFAKEWQ